MKKLMIFALFLTVACDAPKQTRYPSSGQGFDSVVDGGNSYGDSNDGGSTDYGDDSFDPSPDETPSTPGFENCNIGHRYNGGSIGSFGICQSTQDQRIFAVSFADSDLSVGTCFVPMNIQGGVSHNLGRAECVRPQNNKTYYATLYKNQYNQYKPINAVMVVKYSSINSFMQCMNAKADYINGHPGCFNRPSCMSQAQQYASTVCTSFVNNHGSHYKQVAF